MKKEQLLQKIHDYFLNKTKGLVSKTLLDILPADGDLVKQVEQLGILKHEGKKVEAVMEDGFFIDLLVDNKPLLNISPKAAFTIKQLDETSFNVSFKSRDYKILGLQRKKNRLNCTVRLDKAGKLYVDSINLFSAAARNKLIQAICHEFHFPVNHIKEDFQVIVRTAENYQFKESVALDPAAMTPKEKEEALKLGKSKDLLQIILRDYEKLGSIGEENNKLISYLAGVSRLFEKPLSILVISSSGAGKSDLVSKTLAMMPPEAVLQVTSLSAKALFYKSENSLKAKILSLEEDAGGDTAGYAIRQLISSSSLTVETTIRDQLDGKIKTQQNRVNCQTAVFITSTNPDSDSETKSRFFILHVDESPAQTKRIVELQKKSRRLSDLTRATNIEAISRKHINLNRLLKPYPIVNPYLKMIHADDCRLSTRRNFPKYLTLIDSICLLRQFQKEVKEYKGRQYLEVDESDMEVAERLFLHVIANSTSELCSHSRELLKLIQDKFSEKEFTRRDIRDVTFWSFSKVQRAMTELVKYELVLLESGGAGQLHLYRLAPTYLEAFEQVKGNSGSILAQAVQPQGE